MMKNLACTEMSKVRWVPNTKSRVPYVFTNETVKLLFLFSSIFFSCHAYFLLLYLPSFYWFPFLKCAYIKYVLFFWNFIFPSQFIPKPFSILFTIKEPLLKLTPYYYYFAFGVIRFIQNCMKQIHECIICKTYLM